MSSMLIQENCLQRFQPSPSGLIDRQSGNEKSLKPVPESDERIGERTNVQIVPDNLPLSALCKETGQDPLVLFMILSQYSFQTRVSGRFGENFEAQSWVGC